MGAVSSSASDRDVLSSQHQVARPAVMESAKQPTNGAADLDEVDIRRSRRAITARPSPTSVMYGQDTDTDISLLPSDKLRSQTIHLSTPMHSCLPALNSTLHITADPSHLPSDASPRMPPQAASDPSLLSDPPDSGMVMSQSTDDVTQLSRLTTPPSSPPSLSPSRSMAPLTANDSTLALDDMTPEAEATHAISINAHSGASVAPPPSGSTARSALAEPRTVIHPMTPSTLLHSPSFTPAGTLFRPLDPCYSNSERVSLLDCLFERLEPDIEHYFSDQPGPFYKHAITFMFTVNEDRELLKGIFTREFSLYDRCVIGKLFPLKRTSELKTGVLEEMGQFSPNADKCHLHTVELFVPKNLAYRRLAGFFLDEDNIVVAKMMGIIAREDEFHLSDAIDSRVSIERASRTQGIYRLSKIEQQKRLQCVVSGLTDTLTALSSIKKSRIEFIEATDGTKLAYRCYQPSIVASIPSSPPPSRAAPCAMSSAILVIVASNSHFHDIIAYRLAKAHPITAYILEMRGYGYSGGPRGASPSKEQVWIDIRTFVRHLKANSPLIPIFLGGHYYQGGLVLNYATWKERESVDGYVFISPNFGDSASETCNQDALSKLSQVDLKSKGYLDSMALSSITGGLFGKNYVQQYAFSEDEHEVNPMIVDLATTNISKALNAFSPRRQFECLDRPFGLWVGEKEELLIPDKLVSYPRSARIAASINILPELTHMGLLNVVSGYIGDWIITLDAVKRNRLIDGAFDINDLENLRIDDCRHTVLRDVDLVINSFVKLGLNETKANYLLANDGSQIKYHIFMCRNKPTANVILIQSDIKVVTAWILAAKCDVAVYCMDLRGIDNGASCPTRESIWNDVKILIRYLKLNDPEIPLLLGGHGYGASVALNYSSWKLREPVNGYLFISPVVDVHSPIHSDQVVVNETNMRKLFAVNESKSWFSQRSYSHSGTLKFLVGFKKAQVYHPEISSIIWDAVVCRNLWRQFKDLEVPFGLWVGLDDELVRADKLVTTVRNATQSLSLKEIQVIPHVSHVGNLINSTAFIVPFIKRFTKIVTPSLSFKLRSPSSEDFEKVQFIGRGSFGKVYLVRHRVSEKYFAMKVLAKADIVDANEVKHVMNERNILRALNSSFVVAYVGSYQDRHHLYILMEYVIGGELFTQLTLRKRFSNDVARFYAAEIILFFEDIHSKHIVYRDLKPENILLDSMGHVRVTDMGFAKVLNKKARTYTFCGTPQYIAPEVILTAEMGPKTGGYGLSVDYYSLGVLIYEMLVGQTPFHDHNVRAIYRRVLYGVVEFPWGLEPAAKELIKALLQRDVSRRLGCGVGQTLEDIKRHKWFKGLDWEQLRRREVTPPFVPKFSHAGDTSNFIPWGRDKPSLDRPERDYGDVFRDF